ncbi:MAG TPA: hypothetical protein VGV59_09250 [Pyrinomonadaceae bacterium]|nr:hypothetical protein [Pyrinomonadaceae bacterium]
MFSRPRYSPRPFFVAALVSCALVACAPFRTGFVARAQQKRAAQTNRPSSSAANKSKARQQQKQKQRQQAVAALREAAEAARDFAGLSDKVAVQAAAADALWPFDEQRARAILRRAWEATLAPGAAASLVGEGETEENGREYLKATQSLVVAAAARHDARLAESFLREGASEHAEARGETAPARQPGGLRRLSAAGQQRLSIASSLLREGEFASAARVAAPLVDEGATRELLAFIMELRTQDAAASEALYARLLERTRADASADANDVLLLSTPVVSPELLVFVGQDGALGYAQTFYANASHGREAAASSLSTRVRRAFFDVAAALLLRPSAATSVQGATVAQYFAISRLLPFFEREATQYVAALNARLAALGASVDGSLRDSLSANAGARSFTHKNPRDLLAPTLEAIARETDEERRNSLRLRAVTQASTLRLWERARRFASEMTDAEMQRSAHLAIAIYQVLSISEAHDNEDPDDLARVVSFVRAADVPPEARAAGFIQSAHIALARGLRTHALELLEEASSLSAQNPLAPSERFVLSMLLAHAYARSADVRAWEHLAGFVRAANEHVKESGELPENAPGFTFELRWSQGSTRLFIPAPMTSKTLYATIAGLDPARALTEIRALEDEVMRAEATIEAARAVLTRDGATRVKAAGGF